MSLIEELKNSHSEIIAMLDRISELGFYSEKGKSLLLSAKDKILAHLEKENEELYPIIRKAASSDERLRRILDIIAKDMEDVKEKALQFYEKYSKGGSDREFSKDYGEILWVIRNRIQREEEILFKEYENCNQ